MSGLQARGTERKKNYTVQTEKDAQNAWIKIIHIGDAMYTYTNYYKNAHRWYGKKWHMPYRIHTVSGQSR